MRRRRQLVRHRVTWSFIIPLRLEVVGQTTQEHELVQICVNFDTLVLEGRPKDMTVTEGRPNGQLRTNEKFHANLSNDPKVGRGLAAAAKLEKSEFVQTTDGPNMRNGTIRPLVNLSLPMKGYWSLPRKV